MNTEFTIKFETGKLLKIEINDFYLKVFSTDSNKVHSFYKDGNISITDIFTNYQESDLVANEDFIEDLYNEMGWTMQPDIPPKPEPELFITQTQLKCILTDSQIAKYLPEADRSFFKYWVKGSPVYRKWHFHKVVYIIREHSIPLRFTSRFYENIWFTKNDGYNQKFFLNLKQEIDDRLKNYQLSKQD